MTFIDFLVLIPLCWFGFLGFKNGLIYEITSIVAIVLGIWLAYHFSDLVASLLTNVTFAKPVAFIIIFVATLLLVHLVGKFATKIIKLLIPGAVDHIFGLLFGVCKVLLVCSVIFYTIQDIDKREIILTKDTKEKSLTYQYVEPIVPHALRWNDSPQNSD